MNESIRNILTGLSAVNILALIALFLTFTPSPLVGIIGILLIKRLSQLTA